MGAALDVLGSVLLLSAVGLAALFARKRKETPAGSRRVAIARTRFAFAFYEIDRAHPNAPVVLEVDFRSLKGVSAVHVHQATPDGKIGPIIAWLATSPKWQATQGARGNNSPCCKSKSACTRLAPRGTPHVKEVNGKPRAKFNVPQFGWASCDAIDKVRKAEVFLVVHGMNVTPTYLDILAHSKFEWFSA